MSKKIEVARAPVMMYVDDEGKPYTPMFLATHVGDGNIDGQDFTVSLAGAALVVRFADGPTVTLETRDIVEAAMESEMVQEHLRR